MTTTAKPATPTAASEGAGQQTELDLAICEEAWRACGGIGFAVTTYRHGRLHIIAAYTSKAEADASAILLNEQRVCNEPYEVQRFVLAVERPTPVDWPAGLDAATSRILHHGRLIAELLGTLHEADQLDERSLRVLASESLCLHETIKQRLASLSSRPATAGRTPPPAATTADAGGLSRAAS